MKKNIKKNTKINVCFYDDMAVCGGTEQLMLDLCNSWSNKYNLTILTKYRDKKFYDTYPDNVKYKYERLNIYTRFICLNKLIDKLFYFHDKKILRMLKKQDRTVLIKAVLKPEFINKLKTKKLYGWFHGDISTNKIELNAFIENNINNDYIKQLHKCICVSKQVKKNILNYLNASDQKFHVLYNPINIKEIQDMSSLYNINKSSNIVRFVWLGRLSKEKGCDLLINSIKIIEKTYKNIEFFIIGNGPEKKSLLKKCKDLKISSAKFLGHKDNPYPYLKSADWFISTSYTEGYSYVSQEAAVLDVPLMLTDVSGTRDLLGENGEYGIIMQSTVESIYKNIQNVLKHPELHNYYKKKIMQRKGIINYDERIKKIEELILE